MFTAKMGALHLVIFALGLFVPKISCVGLDYLLTDEKYYEEPLKNVTNTGPDPRRAGEHIKIETRPHLSLENKATILQTYESELETDEEKDDTLFRTKKTTITTTTTTQASHITNTAITIQDTESTTAFLNNRQILDIIDDSYEDDLGADESHPVARNGQISDYESQFMNKPGSQPSLRISTYQKLYMPDFYNLAPVKLELPPIKYNNLSSTHNTYRRKISKIWYVPEEYPCWELPLLYGELDKSRWRKEVFRLHAKEIKHIRRRNPSENVRDMNWSDSLPKNAHPDNKWCQIQPCYGDHTLCLFTNNKISKICDSEYHVKTPGMLEQMAITNTINSMRNRVASGLAQSYRHLPKAANMQQIMYEHDLEKMAAVWLQQCLPGPAPCSSLHNEIVAQLECTKYARHCCLRKLGTLNERCRPLRECFVSSIIGCLHTWFESAGRRLKAVDIGCGHIERSTYHTVQLLWAKTVHVGCAYGQRANGDVRVVCNFSPGAPFYLMTQFYCGLIPNSGRSTTNKKLAMSLTSDEFMDTIGLQFLKRKPTHTPSILKQNRTLGAFKQALMWGVDSLFRIYEPAWAMRNLNGTLGYVARLVTQYVFLESDQSACGADEPMYVVGEPGSLCVENGQRFWALCYNYRDPTPGYRLVAVLAPVALFTLILYDLFSGVVRQTNY